jgi:hypothetical protein
VTGGVTVSAFIAPIVLAAALAPEAGSRFVVVQGVRVHYQDAGAGKRAFVRFGERYGVRIEFRDHARPIERPRQ